MIKVIIADDHNLVRKGIKQLLAQADDIEVVAEAADGKQLLHVLSTQNADIVVLDISMPGMDGVAALKEINRLFPKVRALILTMFPADQYAVRMFRAGAHGYLTKESLPDELCKAIYAVAAGKRYVNPEIGALFAAKQDTKPPDPSTEILSDREYQVLAILASGMTNKEIADELSISAKTVSTYLSRIQDKLNLRNQLELVRYAVENGIT